MKKPVLVLNRNWMPVNAQKNWSDIFVGICSGAFRPVDITYASDEKGNIDLNTIESLNVINSIAEWADIEVRPYDEYVTTPKRIYRMPAIVVCAKYDQINKKRVQFPTFSNIIKRDQWTCQYTGEKLTTSTKSIDHIIPSSRGGQNTWENLVACKRELNTWKGDRTPKECGLKLIQQPHKPLNGYSFEFMRQEWEMFLDGGSFE